MWVDDQTLGKRLCLSVRRLLQGTIMLSASYGNGENGDPEKFPAHRG